MGQLEQAKRLPDLMDRETLQDIREAATAYSEHIPNDHWAEAFKRLASAADHLDAMVARTQFVPSTEN